MKTTHRLTLTFLVALLALMPSASWSAGETVQLPKPSYTGKMPVETAILRRKSVRTFTGTAMSLAEASQILWAANGSLPLDAVSQATQRVTPSAGGLYPLEVFLVTGRNTVTDLPAGVYHYLPSSNTLVNLADGDNRASVAAACVSQMWMARAPVMLVIGAVFQRTTVKYGNHGVPYVYMEAGNSNENVCLQAESLGLGVGTVGAFQEGQVTAAAKLPNGVTPLLVLPIGK